jgi:hypothetical protein
MRADLENIDLKSISAAVGSQTVFDSWPHWWAVFGVRLHLAGILVSIVLFTLGAPFWFKALRQPWNVKPAITGKVG